jgi:hypothetical protein
MPVSAWFARLFVRAQYASSDAWARAPGDDVKERPARPTALETGEAAAARPGASRHDEWLLDEALLETFPASDPIAPASPAAGHDEVEPSPG